MAHINKPSPLSPEHISRSKDVLHRTPNFPTSPNASLADRTCISNTIGELSHHVIRVFTLHSSTANQSSQNTYCYCIFHGWEYYKDL